MRVLINSIKTCFVKLATNIWQGNRPIRLKQQTHKATKMGTATKPLREGFQKPCIQVNMMILPKHMYLLILNFLTFPEYREQKI